MAVALSGAPGLAGLHAPEREHRCGCRAGEGAHECACFACHAAARRAEEERAPPCHRPAAKAPAAPPAGTGAPCWKGTCGAGEERALSIAGADAFTLPAAARLPALRAAGSIEQAPAGGRELPFAPETPPPRAA